MAPLFKAGIYIMKYFIEPLLLRVAENDGGYWTVCMRLLEEAGAVEGVVQLLEHATSVLSEADDVLVM